MRLKIFILIFFIIGCKDRKDKFLFFRNLTNNEIHVKIVYSKNQADSLMNNRSDPKWFFYGDYIGPQKSKCFSSYFSWSHEIEKFYSDKKIHFLVSNGNAFRKYYNYGILSDSLQFKYLSYSIKELETSNWHIDYKDSLITIN